MDHPIPRSAHPGVEAAYAHLSLITRGQTATLAGPNWFPDVSEFNGPVDWDALEAAYRAGAILGVAIRAGFGTVRADAQFARNQAEARKRGIPVIYYWFAYPAYNTPQAEAAFFNGVVGPLQPNEAQAGDFEDDPAAKPFPRGQAGLDWCRAFLTALEAPQNATWWYTYPFLLSSVGLQALIGAWPFWAADYSATPDSAFAPAIARQFTDCGSTPGVGGCCDQSRVLRPPLSQWLTGGSPSSSTAPSSEDPDMASVVRVYVPDRKLQFYAWVNSHGDLLVRDYDGRTGQMSAAPAQLATGFIPLDSAGLSGLSYGEYDADLDQVHIGGMGADGDPIDVYTVPDGPWFVQKLGSQDTPVPLLDAGATAAAIAAALAAQLPQVDEAKLAADLAAALPSAADDAAAVKAVLARALSA